MTWIQIVITDMTLPVYNFVVKIFLSCQKQGNIRPYRGFCLWGYFYYYTHIKKDHYYILWILILKNTLSTQFTDLSTIGEIVNSGG